MSKKITNLSLSVLLLLFFSRTCFGIEADGLKTASEFWRSLESFWKEHSVTYSRIENGRLYETGEYLRQHDFVLVSSHVGKDNDVKIVNPNYRATIAKRADQSWKIRLLEAEQSVLRESEDRSFGDMFVVQICDPCGVQSVLGDPNLAQDLGVLPEENGLTFKVVSKLPDGSRLSEAYQNAEVRLYGPLDSFPTKCEVMYQGGTGTRLEYSEPENVNGVLIPSVVKATFIDAFGAEGRSPSEYRFDYSKFTSPLESERFYLSFYGLPDPRPTINIRLALGLASLTIVIVILFAAMIARRGKRLRSERGVAG